MKKLIFIDDNCEILQKQADEIKRFFDADGVEDVRIVICQCDLSVISNYPDCLACFRDDGSLDSNMEDGTLLGKIDMLQEASRRVRSVDQIIENAIHEEGIERIELVIDLFLDDKHESLGFWLAKHILGSPEANRWFQDGTLLITMTSSYKSADYSKLKERFFESVQDRDRIEECYRPIDPESKEFIKNIAAFPLFYHKFHFPEGAGCPSINQLLLDTKNINGNIGTYYGNYFGLIYARLFSDRNDTEGV